MESKLKERFEAILQKHTGWIGPLGKEIIDAIHETYLLDREGWISVEDRLPEHKDLVIVNISIGGIQQSVPAIYYNNQSFNGFYKFTTFYTDERGMGPYGKTKLKPKHKINNLVSWRAFNP